MFEKWNSSEKFGFGMGMKRELLYMLVVGILLGCSDRREWDEGIDVIKNERVKSERVVDLSRVGVDEISGFVKRGNRLVVGATYAKEGFARCVNLEDREITRSVSASGGIRSLSSFNSFDGSSVTALDFRTGELIESPVAPIARGESPESITQLPKDKQHLSAVKADDFVIATGLYEEGRYLLYSLVDGSARYFLSYPETPEFPGLRENTKAMLYASSVLRVSPDRSAFVCADMYSGVIDFCRVAGGAIERVKTVRLHYPKVKIAEVPSSRVAYTPDNRFGFMDVAVTGDRVYALYSGKTYRVDRGRAFECQTLLVYDWEGNLVRSLLLDVALQGITYDGEEGAVYGITCDFEMTLVRLGENNNFK